jgi:sigma-E factor negative regulatory protein RseC
MKLRGAIRGASVMKKSEKFGGFNKTLYLCSAFVKPTLQINVMTDIISHDAVVKAIDNECVHVTIIQSSACSGCAAKKMCSSAEAKEKDVDVFTSQASSYQVGQKVVLEGRLTDGRRAAIIAYGLPLLLMLPVLFVAIRLTGSEPLGALCALITVALCYVVIYLFFRKRLQQSFSFRIKH